MSSPPTENGAAETPSQPDEPRSLRIEDWLTVVIMALLALITFANVLVRYFTSSSFAWTEEISVFLMILLAMVAGSAAVARNAHIRIEYFAEGGSALRRKRLARFGTLMVALLFAVIAALSVRVVWDDYRFEETSPGIGVPQWWYSMWLPICSALITVGLPGSMRPSERGPMAGSTSVQNCTERSAGISSCINGSRRNAPFPAICTTHPGCAVSPGGCRTTV